MAISKQAIIKELQLERHPKEGGYFRRTYESSKVLNIEAKERKLLTSIYYLLTDDHSIGYLHKNKSDILHFHHLGGSVKYLTISPQGKVEISILGSDILNGELPQLLVPAGYWKASLLLKGSFGLISEAVSPGFEYEDNELATLDNIRKFCPDFPVELINMKELP